MHKRTQRSTYQENQGSIQTQHLKDEENSVRYILHSHLPETSGLTFRDSAFLFYFFVCCHAGLKFTFITVLKGLKLELVRSLSWKQIENRFPPFPRSAPPLHGPTPERSSSNLLQETVGHNKNSYYSVYVSIILLPLGLLSLPKVKVNAQKNENDSFLKSFTSIKSLNWQHTPLTLR